MAGGVDVVVPAVGEAGVDGEPLGGEGDQVADGREGQGSAPAYMRDAGQEERPEKGEHVGTHGEGSDKYIHGFRTASIGQFRLMYRV